MAIEIPTGALATRTAFGEALAAIVQNARENEVNVNGGWECRTTNHEDYEAVIVEVAALEEE